MMSMLALAGVTAGGCAVVWRAMPPLLPWLGRALLDHPNARSSHVTPTPRGGGLAWLIGLLPAWAVVAWMSGGPPGFWMIIAAAAGLAAVSLVDDFRSLPALPRLGAQAVAVAIGLASLPESSLLFQGWLPTVGDRFVAAILWLWFINLFNFMDGIDGLTGVEAGGIGLGVATLAVIGAADEAALGFGLTLAGTAIGFLVWNWRPARVFLGDVGSVPLGFLIGWLLLRLALDGHWAAALLLPAHHLADATITLLRRLARGARVWAAHREHFYQRAVQAGWSHGRVSGWVGVLNLALIALAAASTLGPVASLAALVAGGALVLALLGRFARAGRRA